MSKREKAIFEIENHIWQSWEYGYPINMTDDTIDAILEALNKQVPVKPALEQGSPSYYGSTGICRDYWVCPKCAEEVGRGNDKSLFCPNCGQAIDWNEGDEE
jgi:rubrerythrin